MSNLCRSDLKALKKVWNLIVTAITVQLMWAQKVWTPTGMVRGLKAQATQLSTDARMKVKQQPEIVDVQN